MHCLGLQLNAFFYFSIIVDKIDENKDLFVNLSELKNWIQFTQRRYLEEDVDRQWRQHNINNSEQVNWEVSFFVNYCY